MVFNWTKILQYIVIHALDKDIKPTHGSYDDLLHKYLQEGISNLGTPIEDILRTGRELIEEAKSEAGSSLISVLLEGAPSSGKTDLAAQIAKNSDFPFIIVFQ